MRKGFIEINTQAELDKFLYDMIDFHDGVISKINYVSGSFGDRDGTCPFDTHPYLIMRIEGVYLDELVFDAVEVLFDEVINAYITPRQNNWTTNIGGTQIKLIDGKFIFALDGQYVIDKIDLHEEWNYHIESKKLGYRLICKKSGKKILRSKALPVNKNFQ